MNSDLAWNNFKCPYTDKPCEKDCCEGCEIEEDERKWLSGIDEGEEE